jgi:hypothetical protein
LHNGRSVYVPPVRATAFVVVALVAAVVIHLLLRWGDVHRGVAYWSAVLGGIIVALLLLYSRRRS